MSESTTDQEQAALDNFKGQKTPNVGREQIY